MNEETASLEDIFLELTSDVQPGKKNEPDSKNEEQKNAETVAEDNTDKGGEINDSDI